MKKTLIVLLILAAAVLSAGCVDNPGGIVVYDYSSLPLEPVYCYDDEECFIAETPDYRATVVFYHNDKGKTVSIIYRIIPGAHESREEFEIDAERLISKTPIGSMVGAHTVSKITVIEQVSKSETWEFCEQYPI